ncbi:MAG: hypothetical protein A4E62_02187 [Syntrophorhabdus sp. PtaU1.Bin002]|nr:MAG: hypothetical protein A4E62_02187 [Syntrophorhabdus sp. PtaU1.Bin002]
MVHQILLALVTHNIYQRIFKLRMFVEDLEVRFFGKGSVNSEEAHA